MKRLCAVAVAASAVWATAQEPQPIEWRHWGGDAAQTKYSAAAEITAANVRDLELAKGGHDRLGHELAPELAEVAGSIRQHGRSRCHEAAPWSRSAQWVWRVMQPALPR